MNVTVLPYLAQDYVNSLYEAQKQPEASSASVSSSDTASSDFSTALSDAVDAVSAASTVSDTAVIDSNDDTLEAIFQKAAETYGVSANLLKAMAKAESNFNPYATSSSGAMGVMQLMPATAASLGVTDAYDAEQNIMGGANYISQLLSKYNGDVSLALAAYNAGSGNVDKYGGIPPFTETQNYVSKILGYLNGGESLSASADTSASVLSSMSDEAKEAVNSALEVIFSKLNLNVSSLNTITTLVNATKDNA